MQIKLYTTTDCVTQNKSYLLAKKKKNGINLEGWQEELLLRKCVTDSRLYKGNSIQAGSEQHA